MLRGIVQTDGNRDASGQDVNQKGLLSEHNLHIAFEITLILKGLFALSEIIAGIGAYLVTPDFLLKIVETMTQGELVQDPDDFIANYLLHSAQHLSISTQHFAGLYLLSHGVVKLWLVVGLLRQKLWYYPTAIFVFGAFIAYQLYRFTLTHSVWLLLITAVDAIVIALSWHEYRFLRRRLQARPDG